MGQNGGNNAKMKQSHDHVFDGSEWARAAPLRADVCGFSATVGAAVLGARWVDDGNGLWIWKTACWWLSVADARL